MPADAPSDDDRWEETRFDETAGADVEADAGNGPEVTVAAVREGPSVLPSDAPYVFKGDAMLQAVICNGSHFMRPLVSESGTLWGWGCWHPSHNDALDVPRTRPQPQSLTRYHRPKADLGTNETKRAVPVDERPVVFAHVEQTGPNEGVFYGYVGEQYAQLFGDREYGPPHIRELAADPDTHANPNEIRIRTEWVYDRPLDEVFEAWERQCEERREQLDGTDAEETEAEA
jgi:hypothetical protein